MKSIYLRCMRQGRESFDATCSVQLDPGTLMPWCCCLPYFLVGSSESSVKVIDQLLIYSLLDQQRNPIILSTVCIIWCRISFLSNSRLQSKLKPSPSYCLLNPLIKAPLHCLSLCVPCLQRSMQRSHCLSVIWNYLMRNSVTIETWWSVLLLLH